MDERRKRFMQVQCTSGEGECPLMSDEYLGRLAERAAEEAVKKLTANIYQEIGRGVLSKLLYVLGALMIGVYIWARQKGIVG